MELFSIGYALLAVQSALLGAVTPELRAVVVDMCKETRLLYLYFYYDSNASEELIDLWQCAVTEASADLGPDCVLDDGVERLDYPKAIPLRGRYAYLRKEPNLSVKCASAHVTREMVDFAEDIGIFANPVSGEKLHTNWGIIHHARDGSHLIPAKPEIYKIEIFPVAYALLAIQRALLGKATPELRAIVVDACKEENLLYIYFYYDGALSEKILALWEYAITEASADLGPEYVLDAGVQRWDYPKKIPFRGRYAYLRKE